MRRRAGEGTIHQRPNGTYCGQVDIGTDFNGKRRRKTVYGRTSEEVTKKMRALLHQLDINGDLPTSDITVGKWLDDWLVRIASQRVKPGTYRSYKTSVNSHIKPSIGNIRLSRLSVAHLRKMHADITSRPARRGGTVSSTTAHNAHRVLSAALADAVREGRVGRNIASVIAAPPKADNERRGLDATAAVALLRAAPDSRWLAALLLGIRQGERLGLRWDYVDLEAGTADIAWSLTRVTYAHGCTEPCGLSPRSCPARTLPIPPGMRHQPLDGTLVLMAPKTRGSRRIVPLPAPLWHALRIQQGITGTSRHGLVWCRDDGGPIDPHDDWQDWQDALTAAGLPKITLHEARHTTASLLLELGVDRRVISELLGHSQMVTTEGYKHVAVDLSRAALEGLAGKLEITPA